MYTSGNLLHMRVDLRGVGCEKVEPVGVVSGGGKLVVAVVGHRVPPSRWVMWVIVQEDPFISLSKGGCVGSLVELNRTSSEPTTGFGIPMGAKQRAGEDLNGTIRDEASVGHTRKGRSDHQRADCSHETHRGQKDALNRPPNPRPERIIAQYLLGPTFQAGLVFERVAETLLKGCGRILWGWNLMIRSRSDMGPSRWSGSMSSQVSRRLPHRGGRLLV